MVPPANHGRASFARAARRALSAPPPAVAPTPLSPPPGSLRSCIQRLWKAVKGTEPVLGKDGRVHAQALRRHNLSEADLREELRLNGASDPAGVQEARYERSGEISVVKKE